MNILKYSAIYFVFTFSLLYFGSDAPWLEAAKGAGMMVGLILGFAVLARIGT
jgi:hypothetical protein